MRVIKSINGTDHTFDSIPIGVARKLNAEKSDPSDFNVAFIAASLSAGGNADATPDYVDSLPFYGGVFDALLAGAFEANGLKVEKKPAGEGEPATPGIVVVPAEGSTSDTSMEASLVGTDTASPPSTS